LEVSEKIPSPRMKANSEKDDPGDAAEEFELCPWCDIPECLELGLCVPTWKAEQKKQAEKKKEEAKKDALMCFTEAVENQRLRRCPSNLETEP